MIVDSSAVIAIIKDEPDALLFSDMLEKALHLRMSAGSYLEAAIVADGSRNPIVSRRLDTIIADAKIRIEPVTETQARIAREAYRDFGKGSGHGAGLNFGDCFAYALAKDTGEELLFKGDDFSKTDIVSVIIG